MAKWELTLDISEAWVKHFKKEISHKEFASIIVEKLNNLDDCSNSIAAYQLNYINHCKSDIIEKFKKAAASKKIISKKQMDELMIELFAWGNIALDTQPNCKRVCWVRTF